MGPGHILGGLGAGSVPPLDRGGDWRVQLVRPARELGRLVGHRVRLFAYPYGRWTRAAFSHLRQAGYLAAFQLASPMDPTGPQWTIRRIMVTRPGAGRPFWTGSPTASDQETAVRTVLARARAGNPSAIRLL